MLIRTALAVSTALLALPAGASAHSQRGADHNSANARRAHKPLRCRRGYVKRRVTVKRRRGHKVVQVHLTKCVKVKKKSAQPSAAAPLTFQLYAHVDPSFTRNPANPFVVTYKYSASARVVRNSTGGATSEPDFSLPEGVLTLYSDAAFRCSTKVGGSTSGGSCPVTYFGLGQHTVTAIYSAEGMSGIETINENVSPLALTPGLRVSYVPFSPSLVQGGESGCSWEAWAHGSSGEALHGCKRWILGQVEVNGSVAGEFTPPPGTLSAATSAPTCRWNIAGASCGRGMGGPLPLTLTAWATTTIGEWSEGGEPPKQESHLAEVGLMNGNELLPSTTEGSLCKDTSCTWEALQGSRLEIPKLEGGQYDLESNFLGPAPGIYADAGYAITEASAPLRFVPIVQPE